MSDKLIYDQPKNKGVENVIKRARQLTSLKWKPVCELAQINGNKYYYSTKSGKPYDGDEIIGMPYSSSRTAGKLIGVLSQPDTFLSALRNPASEQYKRNLGLFEDDGFHPTIKNTYLFYGVVCSAFVNYALDLHTHQSTHEWCKAPDFFKISEQSDKGIELGDTMVGTQPDGQTFNHVMIITGIARDEDGNVKKVEISESIVPRAVARWFDTDAFNEKITSEKSRYRVYRYRNIADVQYKPLRCESGYEFNDTLMLNFGEFSNYRVGETVEFNINADADELVIECDGTKRIIDVRNVGLTEVLNNMYRIVSVSDLGAGSYTAYLVKSGKALPTVSFNVVKCPDITVTKADGSQIERITLKAVCPDGSELTEESPCLYEENGELKLRVDIAVKTVKEGRIIPARAAVQKTENGIAIKMAARFTDENGKIIKSFMIGDGTLLYAYRAKELDVIRVGFDGAKAADPYYISWMEEGALGYYKRTFTEHEQSRGIAYSMLTRYKNDYTQLSVTSINEFGRIITEPVLFVLD